MKYAIKDQRPISKNIGPLLKQARLKHGLTLKSVAEQAGITSAALFRLENAMTCSASNTYERVAEAMGVNYALIVHEAGILSSLGSNKPDA